MYLMLSLSLTEDNEHNKNQAFSCFSVVFSVYVCLCACVCLDWEENQWACLCFYPEFVHLGKVGRCIEGSSTLRRLHHKMLFGAKTTYITRRRFSSFSLVAFTATTICFVSVMTLFLQSSILPEHATVATWRFLTLHTPYRYLDVL